MGDENVGTAPIKEDGSHVTDNNKRPVRARVQPADGENVSWEHLKLDDDSPLNEAEDGRKRRGKRPRKTPDLEDQPSGDEFVIATEFGCEGVAAHCVGLDDAGLVAEEEGLLPEGVAEQAYVDVRNHVLARWRADVTQYLSEKDAGSKLPRRLQSLVRLAWRFLNRHGWINFGVAPAITEREVAQRSESVVVIGAGLAGLAAARQLCSMGFRVVVLEGKDRPGGRVYSQRLEGPNGEVGVADLGGSIITGIDGNPLAVLAKQLGIPLYEIGDETPLYMDDGHEPDSQLDAQATGMWDSLLDRLSELRTAMGKASNSVSMQVALDILWQKHLARVAAKRRLTADERAEAADAPAKRRLTAAEREAEEKAAAVVAEAEAAALARAEARAGAALAAGAEAGPAADAVVVAAGAEAEAEVMAAGANAVDVAMAEVEVAGAGNGVAVGAGGEGSTDSGASESTDAGGYGAAAGAGDAGAIAGAGDDTAADAGSGAAWAGAGAAAAGIFAATDTTAEAAAGAGSGAALGGAGGAVAGARGDAAAGEAAGGATDEAAGGLGSRAAVSSAGAAADIANDAAAASAGDEAAAGATHSAAAGGSDEAAAGADAAVAASASHETAAGAGHDTAAGGADEAAADAASAAVVGGVGDAVAEASSGAGVEAADEAMADGGTSAAADGAGAAAAGPRGAAAPGSAGEAASGARRSAPAVDSSAAAGRRDSAAEARDGGGNCTPGKGAGGGSSSDGGDSGRAMAGSPPCGLGPEEQLLQWHMANAEFANAAPLDSLAMRYWDIDDEYEMEGAHVFLPGGNIRLVQALARSLPIYYNARVNTISYCASGVRVHTDGAVFEADAAVVTVPLGVLKRGEPAFQPPLPPRKAEAVQRLGFGLLNKVVLMFPYRFWGPSDMFGHLSRDPARRGAYFLFYTYDKLAGAPVMAALVAGEAAAQLEARAEGGDGGGGDGGTGAIAEVMGLLRSIYEPRGVVVPPPLSACVTCWGADPLVRGSYSSAAVGCEGAEDYEALAAPVADRLFFAGEATSSRYMATMHGAYMSGLREAANVAAAFDARAASSGSAGPGADGEDGSGGDGGGAGVRGRRAGRAVADPTAVAVGERLLQSIDRLELLFKPGRGGSGGGGAAAPTAPGLDVEFGFIRAVFGPEGSDYEDDVLVAVDMGKLKGTKRRQQQHITAYVVLSRAQLAMVRDVEDDDARVKLLQNDLGMRLVGRQLGPSGEALLEAIFAAHEGRPLPPRPAPEAIPGGGHQQYDDGFSSSMDTSE